jgi:hypothetical protein
MPIIPDNDPNEAYDIVPMAEHPRGLATVRPAEPEH